MKTTTHARLRYPNGESWVCEVPLGVKIGDRVRLAGSDAIGEVVAIKPTKPDPNFDPEYTSVTRTF